MPLTTTVVIRSGQPLAPSRLHRPGAERPSPRSEPSRKNQEPREFRPSLQRRPQPPPLGETARAAGSLDGSSQAAAAGDPSPETQPPPQTHHGAPCRVPGADARPTLTAAGDGAVEGWSSSSSSPKTRGRPAKWPPPLQLPPRPRWPLIPPPPHPLTLLLPPRPVPPPRAQPIGQSAWGRGSAPSSRAPDGAVSCTQIRRLSPTSQSMLDTLCGMRQARRSEPSEQVT